MLVEALGPAFFADGHLPGAVNIPPALVDQLAHGLLPDIEIPVVVYCRSGGASSWLVGRRLEELGYADVRIYQQGKEDWAEHGLPFVRDT